MALIATGSCQRRIVKRLQYNWVSPTPRLPKKQYLTGLHIATSTRENPYITTVMAMHFLNAIQIVGSASARKVEENVYIVKLL